MLLTWSLLTDCIGCCLHGAVSGSAETLDIVLDVANMEQSLDQLRIGTGLPASVPYVGVHRYGHSGAARKAVYEKNLVVG
jgi:hypothetical protein